MTQPDTCCYCGGQVDRLAQITVTRRGKARIACATCCAHRLTGHDVGRLDPESHRRLMVATGIYREDRR
jgi:hypothetical protein